MKHQPLPAVFVTGRIPSDFTAPKGSQEAQRLALATAIFGNAVLMSGAQIDPGPYIQGLLALSDWSNLPLKEFDQSLRDSPTAKRMAMHAELKDLHLANTREDLEHWIPLMFSLGKFNPSQEPGREPVTIRHILKHTDLQYTLKALSTVNGHARTIRLFAIRCMRQVEHKLTDPRSKAALDAAEKHANGLISDDELAAARSAASEAVADIKQSVGRWWVAQGEQAVVDLGSPGARVDVAKIAAEAANSGGWPDAKTLEAQEAELLRVLGCVDSGTDPYPIAGG